MYSINSKSAIINEIKTIFDDLIENGNIPAAPPETEKTSIIEDIADKIIDDFNYFDITYTNSEIEDLIFNELY